MKKVPQAGLAELKFRDDWHVESASEYSTDISTKQVAPSGLRFCVHYAPLCVVVLNINAQGAVIDPHEEEADF